MVLLNFLCRRTLAGDCQSRCEWWRWCATARSSTWWRTSWTHWRWIRRAHCRRRNPPRPLSRHCPPVCASDCSRRAQLLQLQLARRARRRALATSPGTTPATSCSASGYPPKRRSSDRASRTTTRQSSAKSPPITSSGCSHDSPQSLTSTQWEVFRYWFDRELSTIWSAVFSMLWLALLSKTRWDSLIFLQMIINKANDKFCEKEAMPPISRMAFIAQGTRANDRASILCFKDQYSSRWSKSNICR